VVPVVLLAYGFVRNPDVFWRIVRVSQMPQPSTLSYIVDLMIRRVLADEHCDLDWLLLSSGRTRLMIV
jgi:hypothetical protein